MYKKEYFLNGFWVYLLHYEIYMYLFLTGDTDADFGSRQWWRKRQGSPGCSANSHHQRIRPHRKGLSLWSIFKIPTDHHMRKKVKYALVFAFEANDTCVSCCRMIFYFVVWLGSWAGCLQEPVLWGQACSAETAQCSVVKNQDRK